MAEVKKKSTISEVNINGERIAVNLDSIGWGQQEEIEEKMVEVRLPFHPYVKYPMEEIEVKDAEGKPTGEVRMESTEEWQKRIQASGAGPKEDESPEEHARRVMSTKDYKTQLLGAFNAITSSCLGRVLKEEDLKKANYKELKQFVYEVLTYCNVGAEDFKPIDIKELGK